MKVTIALLLTLFFSAAALACPENTNSGRSVKYLLDLLTALMQMP